MKEQPGRSAPLPVVLLIFDLQKRALPLHLIDDRHQQGRTE